MKKNIIRNSIILIVVIIIAVLGYNIFFKKGSAPTTALVTTPASGTVAADASAGSGSATGDASGSVGQAFLTQLLNVQSINLDDSIFSSQAFTVLQDFSHPPAPDTNPGRPNPFAPIGSDGVTASSLVSTSNPSSVTGTTSMLNGAILSASGTSVSRWFEYGTTLNFGAMTTPETQANPGAFAQAITGLTPNTSYYVRADAVIGGVTVTGNIIKWTTAQSGTPAAAPL